MQLLLSCGLHLNRKLCKVFSADINSYLSIITTQRYRIIKLSRKIWYMLFNGQNNYLHYLYATCNKNFKDRKISYCERTNLLIVQLYSNVIPKKTKQYSFIIKILWDREHVYTLVMKDTW